MCDVNAWTANEGFDKQLNEPTVVRFAELGQARSRPRTLLLILAGIVHLNSGRDGLARDQGFQVFAALLPKWCRKILAL